MKSTINRELFNHHPPEIKIMDSAEQPYDVSESDSDYDSDDSQDDPTFDLLEETQSSLSKLSIKKQKSMDIMSVRYNL